MPTQKLNGFCPVFLLFAAFFSVAQGCQHGAAKPQVPRLTLHTPSAPITLEVEIADTAWAQARGLMYRKTLAPSAGMLFIFDHEQPHTFWMRNTYIPLDMIFINAAKEVVDVVHRAQPLTLQARGSERPSTYVLEVVGGFAQTHAIGPGTRVSWTGVQP